MPGDHNKIGSVRAGRLLRVGRDLFSITLDDRFLGRILVSVLSNNGRQFLGQIRRGSATLYLRLVAVREITVPGTDSCGAESCGRSQKEDPRRAQRMACSGSAMKEAEKAATTMARKDVKTVKKLECRRDAAMAEGNRILAWECLTAIQSLQGRQ